MNTFTAYVEFDTETNLYSRDCAGVTRTHTQAAHLMNFRKSEGSLELCLEKTKERIQAAQVLVAAAIEVVHDRFPLSIFKDNGKSSFTTGVLKPLASKV
jgi:hypothetical protein